MARREQENSQLPQKLDSSPLQHTDRAPPVYLQVAAAKRTLQTRRKQQRPSMISRFPDLFKFRGVVSPRTNRFFHHRHPPPPPGPTMSDLRPPEHQVAGHRASANKLGPLVDGSGLFYKPLQAGDRGEHELAFYEAFSAHAAVPPRIRDTFFPRFHGTRLLPTEARPGEPHPHLALDDLLAGLQAPSVADVKIGAITWPPSSPEPYVAKCLAKDRGTTSVLLGFRVSGVRVVGPGGAVWRPERPELKALDTAGVRRVLRRYVSSVAGEGVDCALAAAVYGGEGGILSQLRELKAWFEEQTLFHFYSASILLGYDANAVSATGVGVGVRVKLVDFAHVAEGDGVIDHNFLGGLCSLIKFISDIVSETPEMPPLGP